MNLVFMGSTRIQLLMQILLGCSPGEVSCFCWVAPDPVIDADFEASDWRHMIGR